MTYDQNKSAGQGGSQNKMASEAKVTAKKASEQAKEQVRSKLDANRETAASELDSVAHAVKAAASDLHEQNKDGLSNYVTEIANTVSTLADGLRAKSVDELLRDVEGIARRNPALFVAGSLAIGLGISRFAKASSRRSHSEEVGASNYSIDNDTDSSYSSGYTNRTTQSQYTAGGTSSDTGLAGSLAGGYGATTSASAYGSEATEDDYAADDYAAAGMNDVETFSNEDDAFSNNSLSAGDRNKTSTETTTSTANKTNNPIGGTRYDR